MRRTIGVAVVVVLLAGLAIGTSSTPAHSRPVATNEADRFLQLQETIDGLTAVLREPRLIESVDRSDHSC